VSRHIRLLPVTYSCGLCGLVDAKCWVNARGKEGVVTWMQSTIAQYSADHAERSPGCHPKELQNLKVPVDKDGSRIGDPLKEPRP